MRLLTAKETAEILRVTQPRVYELARSGLLPCVRMGRQIRFDEEKLREWAMRGGSPQIRQEQPQLVSQSSQ